MSLKEIVDGIDTAVKQDPANANAVFRVSGSGRGSLTTDLRSGRHHFTADEPTALGGDDLGPTPVDLALGGLISCQVAVYRFWAAKLGIALDDISVTAEGDLDVRGFFGLAEGQPDAPRAGFTAVRFAVTLTGPESDERYEELRSAVDAHCPVLDLFSNPTPVTSTVEIRSGSGVTVGS